MPQLLLPTYRSNDAIFSRCRCYRYTLWRRWAVGATVNFIMLNPSTADEIRNDPTVERCERRARGWGYAGLVVTNLFALRATDPAELRATTTPEALAEESYRNDHTIVSQALKCGLIVCAWGEHGLLLNRSQHVISLLRHEGLDLHYLKLNRSGEPAHPLYLGYDLKPVKWEVAHA